MFLITCSSYIDGVKVLELGLSPGRSVMGVCIGLGVDIGSENQPQSKRECFAMFSERASFFGAGHELSHDSVPISFGSSFGFSFGSSLGELSKALRFNAGDYEIVPEDVAGAFLLLL